MRDYSVNPTGKGGGMGKMTAEDKKYQAEDDVRILSRAKEVEMAHEKDPERKKMCQQCAQKKMDEMKAVLGTKK